MDYEKKYNEALERARALWREAIEKEYVDDYLKDYETIFPELREIDDERIRKWILEYLYDGLRKADEQFKDHFKIAIDWLEKRKGQMMMKEAVDLGTADLYWEAKGDRAFPTFDPPVDDLLLPDIISQKFEDGQKVRIFIVKED